MKHTIVIECPPCEGTGLLMVDETAGTAITCDQCKGTGKVDFTYNEFTGRKHRPHVQKILPR